MKILILLITILNFIYADASFEIEKYSYIGDIKKVKEYIQKSKTIPDQALLNAGYKNHSNIVKLLLKNGADIKAQSYSGRDILYYAVQNNNLELLIYLVNHGGKFRDTNFGNDALFEAVEYGYIEIVKYLLPYFKYIDRYYHIARPDSDLKTTLLITAIQNNHLDVAKFLIKNSANINLSNNRGETPLLTSLRNKHFEMARYLIEKGADLKAQDIGANNAFTYGVVLKQEDIALKALEFVDITQWVDSSIFDAKPYIYEYYIFETRKQWQFASYLHLTIRYGQTKVIEKLLQKGLKLDTLLEDKNYKLDALQLSIYYSDVKTVKILVKNGANPYKIYNSSIPWGYYNTLLSYTMIVANTTKNRKEILEYLLTLPNVSWYKKYEDMQKIKKFLAKKPKFYKDNSDKRLKDAIKNNDYLDVIHSSKHNHKLIDATKEMLKLKYNINQEISTNYNYKGTLLLEYFEHLEFNIKLDEIKELLKMGATLGDSKEALRKIYLLYNSKAVKQILKDKLFQKQVLALHKKYDITDIAISVYKDKRRANKRIEWMLELVYKYKLNFDFKRFKKVVEKDDRYMNKLVRYYENF